METALGIEGVAAASGDGEAATWWECDNFAVGGELYSLWFPVRRGADGGVFTDVDESEACELGHGTDGEGGSGDIADAGEIPLQAAVVTFAKEETVFRPSGGDDFAFHTVALDPVECGRLVELVGDAERDEAVNICCVFIFGFVSVCGTASIY
ncbi:MAG: hypothetical protein OSA84_02695 [Akkermansiaceae bacterium]|nr:hypothetical protein [Akkermansiaceae bacterium]